METHIILTDESDTPKMIRETLQMALGALASGNTSSGAFDTEIARIVRMIKYIDMIRPVGSNGKHGNQHTPLCGCEDV
jgi:hypothetical protein